VSLTMLINWLRQAVRLLPYSMKRQHRQSEQTLSMYALAPHHSLVTREMLVRDLSTPDYALEAPGVRQQFTNF
jgi:hypothetical protein